MKALLTRAVLFVFVAAVVTAGRSDGAGVSHDAANAGAATKAAAAGFGIKAVDMRSLRKAKATTKLRATDVRLPDVKAGIYLSEVNPWGSFGKSGIGEGDIVVKLNGVFCSDLETFGKQLHRLKVGDEVPVVLQQFDGKRWWPSQVKLTVISVDSMPKRMRINSGAPQPIKDFWETNEAHKSQILREACIEFHSADVKARRGDVKFKQDLAKLRKKLDGLSDPAFLTYVGFKEFKVGQIGMFAKMDVIQVLGDGAALVRGTDLIDSDVKFPVMWLSSIDTKGLVDGNKMKFKALDECFEIVGTKRYSAVSGASNTVYEIKPVDPRKYLEETP